MSRRKKIAVVLILAFAIAAGGVAVITLYRLLSPQVSPDGHRPISSRNGAGSGSNARSQASRGRDHRKPTAFRFQVAANPVLTPAHEQGQTDDVPAVVRPISAERHGGGLMRAVQDRIDG